MGAFAKINRRKGSSSKGWGPLSALENDELVYLQFIPAYVSEVITNADSDSFAKDDRRINGVKVITHIGNETYNTNLSSIEDKIYYPLLRGFVDVPTQGDPVLVCSFGGVDFYLGPVNTLNNPNFNPDHMKKLDSSPQSNANIGVKERLGINPFFKWRPTVKRLQKPYIRKLDSDDKEKMFGIGDMLLESRHGNSIRIGSRSGYPNIFISNGRNDTNTVESINDANIMSFTTKGNISDIFQQNYLPSSNHEDLENKRPISFNDEDVPQMLLRADKLTFDSRKSDITLSSYNNLFIGTGNDVSIYNKGKVIIESKNIYLGEKATNQEQPLVLGKALEEILNLMINAIGQLYVGGIPSSGISMPVQSSGSPGWSMIDQQVRNKIKDLLSDKHFIEGRGSKS